MKIGIFYDDVNRMGLDCSQPQKGNPGVGGTQYCFLMLIYYLCKYYPEFNVFVYRKKEEYYSIMPFEEKISYRFFENEEKIVEEAKKDRVDFLIFSHTHAITLSYLLKKYNLQGIVWIHNWIRGELLSVISHCEQIKRAVFLGVEHYDQYIDHDIINKAVIIPNMFNCSNYPIRINHGLDHTVTYVGAIIEGKGFDALAKAWKDVVLKVPDANLLVLGKGDLYGNKSNLGTYGIASQEFENKFIPYLVDASGNIMSSVHFLGILGASKKDIYNKTKVGIVNPTAVTEVCSISALEMAASGIPIISKNKNGMPDVVINGKTGILIRRQQELSKQIIRLLVDDKYNYILGENARKFVEDNYVPEKIITRWHDLFMDVCLDKPVVYMKPYKNFANNAKYIRVFFKGIRKFIPCMPSFIQIESYLRKIIS